MANRTFEDITNKPSQQGDGIQVTVIFSVRFQVSKHLLVAYLLLDRDTVELDRNNIVVMA